tara:strand:+ start:17737 stop:18192 length:456 start_codon:yes stop_codon:yes gene_type:complete
VILNKNILLNHQPIKDMINYKDSVNGLSWGLTEAGYDIRIKQRVVLCNKSRFKLASSVEEFNMPDNLVAVVHDKSTWARVGLSVFNTVIEPGWKGFLTLELVYHGYGELVIEEGSPIAQVLFSEIYERSSYKGKYQNQKDEPVNAIIDKPV